MNDMTANEMNIALKVFKEFTSNYNANNLAKAAGLTAMGALKILNRLEQQKVISYQHIGKAKIAHINYTSAYAKQYISFLLRREAEESTPEIKRWITEIRTLEETAEIGILFGSVLTRPSFNDVDVLLTIRQSAVADLSKKVAGLNSINVKRIHAIKQSRADLKENLMKKDKILLQAIRGIVAFGYEDLVEVVASVSRRT
jgi:DNA-binding Lrp family transcriptional regulator